MDTLKKYQDMIEITDEHLKTPASIVTKKKVISTLKEIEFYINEQTQLGYLKPKHTGGHIDGGETNNNDITVYSYS